ncbi:disabled homolog 2 isoform X2 [Kryptolebias marmoratus]|uniref:disabled homolog 2 isoform X2 n=1 Tax=Kryptolebias marmoratus TaxID=37003 RepID=UPI000D52FF90|nr:disabled homolog 2 isoform X2 [Kryptolebias marmoratus]
MTEQTAGSFHAAVQTAVRTGPTSRTEAGAPSRFHGDGVRYKAKLIGMDPVPDTQGEKMCRDSMMKLKGLEAAARKQGKHKPRIWLKISSSGLKILDERTGILVYEHDRNRISSLTKDEFDPRALAYIYQNQDAFVLFYIKTAHQADPVLLDLKEICHKVTQETSDEPTENQNISLVLLNEAPATLPEAAAFEDVFSAQPEPSSGQANQVSVNNELMEVFSPPLEQPLSPSQMSCVSQPESPQPTLSTAQILSMFPQQPVGGSPFTPPPQSPTTGPWGQQGLQGNQWAGHWPTSPGVPAWMPQSATAPPAGGQPQGCSVASPQPGFMMAGGVAAPSALNGYSDPLETLSTPAGSAVNLGATTFYSHSLL